MMQRMVSCIDKSECAMMQDKTSAEAFGTIDGADNGAELSGTDGDASASESAENARLDAMDALPENRRRSVIVLSVIAILIVTGLAVVIAMPPLSWTPQKEVKSNFYALQKVTDVEIGGRSGIELSYAPIVDKVVYHLELDQTTRYDSGGTSHVTLHTDVELMRPGRRESEDAVQIQLSDVETHVFDGDREVTLASAGAMLAGISLYSRLASNDGLVSVVPDANINPQVARVLYILADAMRQIWQPLPKESLGRSAHWKIVEDQESGIELAHRAEVHLGDAADGRYELVSDIQLFSDRKGVHGAGKGNSRVILQNGVVQEGQFVLEREGSVVDGGGQQQRVEVRMVKK